MKKLTVLAWVVLAFCLNPAGLFATTYCLQDGTGGYYYLSGGKIDQKPFAGYFVVPGMCHTAGWGVIYHQSFGTPQVLRVTWFSAHDSGCRALMMSGETDITLNGTMIFDNGGNGTVEGTSTLTAVSCKAFPNVPAGKQLQKYGTGRPEN